MDAVAEALVRDLSRDNRRTTNDVIAAAETLLLQGGHQALTLRGIAAEAGVGASTLLHRHGDKEWVLTKLALDVRDFRLWQLETACGDAGVAGWVPRSRADDLRDRSWLAVRELALAIPIVGQLVQENRKLEIGLVARTLGMSGSSPIVPVVRHLLAGLVDDLVTGLLAPDMTALEGVRWRRPHRGARPPEDQPEHQLTRQHARRTIEATVVLLQAATGLS